MILLYLAPGSLVVLLLVLGLLVVVVSLVPCLELERVVLAVSAFGAVNFVLKWM
ncbi:MAG: hypothetical protein GY940_16660 [bacterium]|nr:hypothetical protein [bacterium]